MTNLITSVAALLLVDEGRLALDDRPAASGGA
jgi:CubicO group peptidase (beta-lactamase class C family)